ncbi:hypothetical protein [Pelistega ratti]|nr:hypothetical protein [Pelistega ratti]
MTLVIHLLPMRMAQGGTFVKWERLSFTDEPETLLYSAKIEL